MVGWASPTNYQILGEIGAIDQLLSLLDNADESLAINILNILTDLTERQRRSSLAADAPHINNILERCARRFPILGTHAEEIIATGASHFCTGEA